ncbi:hypothetical protein RB595_004866 [Gaeumannomyces hyphopodioides]
MSDNANILRWIRALPNKSSEPPFGRKRKRRSGPPSPPRTDSNGSNFRAAPQPPATCTMNTPPPERHHALASRTGSASAAVGDADNADGQTPRPAATACPPLSRGRLTTLQASPASSTTTNQRTGSSSPRKRRAELEVEPKKSSEVRPLTGNEDLPRELLVLDQELDAVADGYILVLHLSLRPELREVAENAGRRGLRGYNTVETAFAREARGGDGAAITTGGGGGGLIDNVSAAAVRDLLLAAARCHKRGQDENGWNQAVHFSLPRLALPLGSLVDFEPWYSLSTCVFIFPIYPSFAYPFPFPASLLSSFLLHLTYLPLFFTV